MQGPKIKVGLVGGGAIMRLSHAPTIKASKDAELVAVFDTDLNRAEGLTREFGGKAFDHLEAMLDVPGLDAVIVATPNKYHEEGVVAAAKHSKHVLCEKPLSVDAAAARRMVKACGDAKVVLQVRLNQRFWAQVEIAKQLIDAGFNRPLTRRPRGSGTISSSREERRSSTSRFIVLISRVIWSAISRAFSANSPIASCLKSSTTTSCC
jgi:predicted dehydrogenase